MAYNASNEERTELAVIQKNNRGDNIIVAKIKNKNTGTESIDIRNYYTDDNGELKPSSKGIRLNMELAAEVVKAVLKSMHIVEVEDIFDEFREEVSASDNEDSEDNEDNEDK